MMRFTIARAGRPVNTLVIAVSLHQDLRHLFGCLGLLSWHCTAEVSSNFSSEHTEPVVQWRCDEATMLPAAIAR